MEAGTLEKYSKKRLLGKSRLGEVWQMEDTATKEVYAAKYVPMAEVIDEARFLEEVKQLKNYKHPCIVEYKDCIQDKTAMQLILLQEYCAGKALTHG